MKKLIILTGLVACSAVGFSQPRRMMEAFQTETPMVHDPVMAMEDGTYHLFATGMGIQKMTSKDRKSWTVHAEPVMSVIPKWTHDSVPGFRNHVWAPDIIQWHGRWWLAYSCSTFGKNGSAIGLLSCRSLSQGLWNDEGCIVTSREQRDNWNAIDPNFVIDDDDNPWLVWGSFWDGIQLVRLDTTMHIGVSQQPRTIARRYNLSNKHVKASPNPPKNPTSDYAGPNAIEAPFIFKHDGWYYLFVSSRVLTCVMVEVISSLKVTKRHMRPPAIVLYTVLMVRTSLSVMAIASPTKVLLFLFSTLLHGRQMVGRR